MIAFLTRLKLLSPIERKLVVEATLALAVAALAIALFPFRRIAAIAGRRPVGSPAAEGDCAQTVRQVRWAIGACARRVPWRAKCFEQGLAAQWMLRQRCVPATLHYGVARRDDRALVAHVWIKAGPIDVVGCEISGGFSELARFPADR